MFRKSAAIILMSSAFVYQSINCADWLDQLASTIGATTQWDKVAIDNVINDILKKDISEEEKYIEIIEKKLKEAETGFWGSLHRKEYQIELSTAKSNLNYYIKIVKTLESFETDEKKRNQFIKNLNSLYLYQQEIDNLAIQYQNSKSMGTVIKVGTLLRLEQTKLLAKKAQIKSSFFLFD